MSATIAFESPADQAGWVQLPNVVLMDASLSMPARLLYALLLHFARQDGSCYPGQEVLGGLLGVTDRSVRDYLTELERAMLIRRDSRGRGRTCLYVILALGLRAKRMSERSPEEGFRRKQASGHAGSELPAEVEAEDKDTDSSEETRARQTLKITGRPVKPETWQRTTSALAEFNRQAGKSLAAVTGTGQPSEAAKRVYSRLAAWPKLDEEEVSDAIRRTLASRWWGSDPPSIGVVFGPKVFEENLSRSETTNGAPQSVAAPSSGSARMRAMAADLRAQGAPPE